MNEVMKHHEEGHDAGMAAVDIVKVAEDRLKGHFLMTGDRPPVNFPWTIIIDIVLQLLAGCKLPTQEIQAHAARKTRTAWALVRQQVRRKLRDEYGLGAYYALDGERITAAIMAAGADSAEGEIALLKASPCCQAVE